MIARVERTSERSAGVLTCVITGAILLVLTLDVATLFMPGFGKAGMLAWAMLLLALVAAWGCEVWFLIRRAAAGTGVATLLCVALLLLYIFDGTTRPSNQSGETSQELACAVNLLAYRDWGFHQTCLFGYPARQFALPIVPTLLFGPSQMAQNLGGMSWTIIGLVFFACGLVRFCGRGLAADLIAAIHIAMLPHLHWFDHFQLEYEQSSFPISFTMGMAGAGLSFLKERKLHHLVVMGAFGFVAIFGYTPALAAVGLAVTVLTYLSVRPGAPRAVRAWALLLAGCLLIGILVAFQFRFDVKVFGGGTVRSEGELLKDLRQAWRLVVWRVGHPVFASELVLPYLLLVAAGHALFLRGWRPAFLAWWCIAVFVLAVLSRGYAYYGVPFRLHRALVAVPVLLALGAGMLTRIVPTGLRARRCVLALFGAVLVGVGCSGAGVLAGVQAARSEHRHLAFVQWFESLAARGPLHLTFSSLNQVPWLSIYDVSRYYIPRLAQPIFSKVECPVPMVPPRVGGEIPAGYIAIPLHRYGAGCGKGENYRILGTFRFKTDEPMVITRRVS